MALTAHKVLQVQHLVSLQQVVVAVVDITITRLAAPEAVVAVDQDTAVPVDIDQ